MKTIGRNSGGKVIQFPTSGIEGRPRDPKQKHGPRRPGGRHRGVVSPSVREVELEREKLRAALEKISRLVNSPLETLAESGERDIFILTTGKDRDGIVEEIEQTYGINLDRNDRKVSNEDIDRAMSEGESVVGVISQIAGYSDKIMADSHYVAAVKARRSYDEPAMRANFPKLGYREVKSLTPFSFLYHPLSVISKDSDPQRSAQNPSNWIPPMAIAESILKYSRKGIESTDTEKTLPNLNGIRVVESFDNNDTPLALRFRLRPTHSVWTEALVNNQLARNSAAGGRLWVFAPRLAADQFELCIKSPASFRTTTSENDDRRIDLSSYNDYTKELAARLRWSVKVTTFDVPSSKAKKAIDVTV